MKFSELQKMLNEAQKLNARIRKEERALPMRFNILEAGKQSRKENLYSNLIAFLLDPSEGHKVPAFGKHFLDMLRKKMPALKGERIEHVKREAALNDKKRVDILIHTNNDEIIILENKIGAVDQPKQLHNYYERVTEQNPRKKIFVTYLTLAGADPSEESITSDRVKHLTREHRFSCISYRKEMLLWIEKCMSVTKPKQDADNFLRTGLLQFQDAIKGLCDMQEADTLRGKMVLEGFLDKHFALTEAGKRGKLFELIGAKDTITQGVDALVVIQLLSDIHAHLEEREVRSIQYTHSQQSFTKDNRDDWIKEIIKCAECVGIEISLKDNISIGIEFSTLDSTAEITFGFMTHSDGDTTYPFSESMKKGILNHFRASKFPFLQNNEGYWWWEYVSFRPNQASLWLHKEIFGQGDQEQGWIAEHIAENWFCPLLELYKQYL